VIDVVPVVFYQALDVLATRARLRAGIRYRTTETHIVAEVIRSSRVLQRVLDVRLLDLEVAIHVASVVRLAAIRHLLCSCCVWSLSNPARGRE